ncbi:hypothetical protein U9M48_007440 [Paspalum notatum var. saurae]|uniref:Fe2OG dioxygenase domain-containing protein n=1 Tax=Paspalum notatum var. saurae TaxID=547442 RepID=A0AAQ3SMH8_PASNO
MEIHLSLIKSTALERGRGIPIMAETAREIGSLPVTNVQALAETCNTNEVDDDLQVPERYLSKEPNAEEVIAGGDGNCAIPVIDLDRLVDPRSSSSECAKLVSACRHWGFFQLINHGVPDQVIGNLKSDVVEFFKQPLEDKQECAQQPGNIEGYGQAFVVSEDQKLDWADMLYILVQPTESRDLRFWPTRPPSFRNSVDAYSLEATELGYRLLEFMAKGVGAESASLRGVFEGQPQGMRVNCYPACRQAADRVLGLSPHSDPGGLTLLLQINNDVHGLQVKKDGKWFAVEAMDGAFIVNVGDALEIMSNGKFTSVEHRAVIHPTKERTSVALFFFPSSDTIVGPLLEFTKGDEVRYTSTSYQDYMKQYFAEKLDGKKNLERLRLLEL